jgi:threonylcarbamoyladenosine tRNA methylthiotransferase MtaB
MRKLLRFIPKTEQFVLKGKFRVATLGCRTNQYESRALQNQLEAIGWIEAEKGEVANLCIVNTCTVTASADSHSRREIRSLARKNPGTELVVTGCFADRVKDEILEIEGVSRVVANKDKELIVSSLFPEEDLPEFSINTFPEHTRAFVKIQDGCNSFCTYCIIPYVRGRSRSRTIPEVIKEVKDLVASGYKEIVLTGINIGDFDGGKAKGEEPDTLANLIRLVDEIPGVERIRVSSIDPDEVDNDLLDAIINGKKTCHSMHLVLQSGSNVTLKRMNRKYTRQMFYDSVRRLQEACPDFTFTTDIIVGFPGETKTDHEETLEVIDGVNFAKVHMFPYSDRPRTKAATYENKVPSELMRERKQVLLRHAEKTAYHLRERFVGRRMTILTEHADAKHEGMIAGHTDNFLMVWIPKGDLEANQLVEVDLTENTAEGLIGQRVVEEAVC